jgi:hypothetical protein
MRNWMKLTIVGSVATIAVTLTALVFLRPQAATTIPAGSVDPTGSGYYDTESGSTGSNGSGGSTSGGSGGQSGTPDKDSNQDTPQDTPGTGNPQTTPTTMVAPPAPGGGGRPPVGPRPGTVDPGPVVRDHRGEGGGPIVRDHRDQPVVRDHRDQPVVRDHRGGSGGGQSCVNLPVVGKVCSPL